MSKRIYKQTNLSFNQYYGTKPRALEHAGVLDPKATAIEDVLEELENNCHFFSMGQLRQQFFAECSWSVEKVVLFLIRCLQEWPDHTRTSEESLVRKVNQIVGNINLGESNKKGKPVDNLGYICGFDLFAKSAQPRVDEAGTMDIIFRFKAVKALGGTEFTDYFPVSGTTALRLNMESESKGDLKKFYNRLSELFFRRKYFKLDPDQARRSNFPSYGEFENQLESMYRGEENGYLCRLDDIEPY